MHAEPERAPARLQQRDRGSPRGVGSDGVDDERCALAPRTGEQPVRELFGTHRRVGDGLGPGAAFVIRLADENPHGAEEARDDAGQRPYRPGAQYDHGSGKRERAEPKRMDARCNRLGQHRNVGGQLVVDDVSATRRNRDELAEPTGPCSPDELAVLTDVLVAGTAARAQPAGNLGVHRDAATDERLRLPATQTSPRR